MRVILVEEVNSSRLALRDIQKNIGLALGTEFGRSCQGQEERETAPDQKNPVL